MDIQTLRRHMAERDSFSILGTVDVHTGVRSALKEFDYVIEAPNWTRDGRRLVYNSRGRMYTYELSTGEVKQIDTGFAVDCNNDHVLSPDNTQIAVSHFTNEDAKSRIYIVPFEGGSPTLVTEEGPSYLHGWSPDGASLAYCAERNGQYDIYTISVNGGPETQLTNLPGLDDGPEYAPSGRHIWFNSVRSGLMQIWRMEADGSNPVQMVREDANCWFPHVSPDGNWVAYIAYDKDEVAPGDHPANMNVEIRLMPADGGASRPIVALFGGQGTMNVNSWSPDSRTLAFVSYRLKSMSEAPTAGRKAFGDIAPALAAYTDDVLFGNVWERPGLSKRDRSLITVATLVALYRTNELPFHLKRALENGVTRDELIELITHLAFYSGWPTASSALTIARRVFHEEGV